jgi:hypothetical protein
VQARRRRPQFESLEGRALLALDFTSAIGVGGGSFFIGQVALDAAGDTYLTGGFTGQVNFDPSSNPKGILNGGAAGSAFVAKYSPSNALVWVKEFAAEPSVAGSLCVGSGLAVVNDGSTIYVGGVFAGSVDFNAGSSPPDPVTSNGSKDGFLVALTSDGAVDPNRVRTFGGPGYDAANIVKLSPDGTSVYVSGQYTGTVNFDPDGTNAVLNDPFSGGSDTFVMKLASTFTTTTGFGFVQGLGEMDGITNDLNADSSGNVYVVGGVPVSSTNEDAFLAKVDTHGKLIAVRAFSGPASGGTNGDATGVVVDSTGSIYVCGNFAGTGLNFATNLGPGVVTLDSAGAAVGYLIKLDPSLNLQWARRVGSTGDDITTDLAIDANNILYMTGGAAGPTSFGGTGPGTTILDNTTGHLVGYVLEVNGNGDFLQAISAGGTGPSRSDSIAVNGSGKVAIAGRYAPTATFNGVSLGTLGTGEFFLASLSNSATHMPASPTSPTSPPTFDGALRLSAGKGRKRVTGFELKFSAALDAGVAASVGHYRVTQPGPTKHSAPKLISVRAAQPGAGGTSVTLMLGKYTANKPLTLTATGLTGTGGAAIATIVTKLQIMQKIIIY